MEHRLFEDAIAPDTRARKARQALTFPVSVAGHAIAIGAVALVPLLTSEELPEPRAVVRTFFIAPAPAPAPPSLPPRQGLPVRRVQTTPRLEETSIFKAPLDVPDEIRPEDGLDTEFPAIVGGIPGHADGLIGDIVGGLPELTPREALRVGGHIEEPRRLRHISPVYPDIAARAGVQGVVILECTISPQGRVGKVKVLRGIPLLDQAAIEAVQQWVYTPTLLNGVPVSVVMTVTVNFTLNR